MPITNAVTDQKTYQQYLHEIGVMPTKQLERSFACGLPAVWLYLKAIGLEELFFDLIAKSKTRPELYKELLYLLMLTNGHNKFFPHPPEDLLKLEIPREVKAAQVEIDKPVFEMAYSFSRDQLIKTLSLIAQPNAMIRVGTQRKSIGIMFNDDVYHVYHSDNPHALEFKSVEKCADLIMRVLNEQA
jgi:hypothetical protein